MTELMYLQDQFQQFLLIGNPGISDSVVSTLSVSVDRRLAIYRDAYRLRLIESLITNFPGLYLYLGTETFEKLCSAYIDAHPSIYRSIRWYGDVLADFLKSYYDRQYAHLTELAEFEWNMTLAFDAADDPVVQVEDMAFIPAQSWARLKFIMHQSVKRMDYFWNVIPFWQSLIHDQELPALVNNSSPTAWILWRSPDYSIQFYTLSKEEAWALDSLIHGLSFGELCEGLCQWVEVNQVGMRAASFLKGWIQKGMVMHLING